MKFNIEKTIHMNRNKIFDIISNHHNFKILLPRVFLSIKIISFRAKTYVAEEHINIFNDEKIITSKYVINRPFSREISILGGDGKGSHITEKYTKICEGTKLNMNIDLKFNKLKIINYLLKNKFIKETSNIVNCFVYELEKRD